MSNTQLDPERSVIFDEQILVELPFNEKLSAKPVGAFIQVAAEHAQGIDSDTMVLNPEWAAKLFRQIRLGGVGSISLYGCLLPGSPELHPNNDYAKSAISITKSEWQGWLTGKPAQGVSV